MMVTICICLKYITYCPVIPGPFVITKAPSLASSTVATLDITNFQRSVQTYYHQGLQRLYGTGQACYYSFCQQLKHFPLTSTEQVSLLLVAHLANEGLTHSTIKVYLSALCNLHIAIGYHQAFASQLTPARV